MNDNAFDKLESDADEYNEADNDFIPPDARPLCPGCLRPCEPYLNYCENCGCNEVINPLASYMPFVRIRFHCGMVGKALRIVLYGRQYSWAFRLLCLAFVVFFVLFLAV